MATYGSYNAGYSTTTYGAQGGADGGGFVNQGYGGSQGGSQDTPGGSKGRSEDTLRPVTIKQIIDATQAHPDADFKLDNHSLSQITFIGQIRSISKQATNVTYKLDDGTGLIDVKQWVDSDAPDDVVMMAVTENSYVRAWGRIKAFNNKKHVGAHFIRPVSDFNEVSMHLLEATYVHLYFMRGPPESLQGSGNASGGDSMFVDQQGYNAPSAPEGGKGLPAGMSATAKRVYQTLQNAPQNNEGLHVQMLASMLGVSVNDVFKAGDELLGSGIIYTTVDDETWAVLEC